MAQMSTDELIDQIQALATELASRKANVRVTIKPRITKRIETIRLIRQLSGFSLADVVKAVDNPGGYHFDFTVSNINALQLLELKKLGHSYEVLT